MTTIERITTVQHFESYKKVLKLFSEKHQLHFTHFTNSDWTSYAWFGDKFNFSMRDIILDISKDRPPNGITAWFDLNYQEKIPFLDYNEYLEIKSLEK